MIDFRHKVLGITEITPVGAGWRRGHGVADFVETGLEGDAGRRLRVRCGRRYGGGLGGANRN